MRDLGITERSPVTGFSQTSPTFMSLRRECRTPTRTARRILERPWDNPASRVTGELTALVGARVMGEHRHPALVEQFTVLEGALSIF